MSTTTLELPQGLPRATSDALAALLGEATGRPLRQPPYLATLMLLSAPEVASALPLPIAPEGQVLIQDYQSLEFRAPLPLDMALQATAQLDEKPNGAELVVDLSGKVKLRSAVRMVPAAELANAKPLALRLTPELGPIDCTHAYVDRYLDLSGDTNPIHRDTDLATKLGLSAPIIPGLLLVALVQPLVEARAPQAALSSLRARFTAPVPVGSKVHAALQERGANKYRCSVIFDGGSAAIVDLALES